MGTSIAKILDGIRSEQLRTDIPDFRVGDSIKVYAKVVEGTKERIQMFEGVVIKRSRGKGIGSSFTVRKISYNIGVERTFLLHSPRIQKIEVATQGSVRRARLFYLRPLRGKKARIKSKYFFRKEDEAKTKSVAKAEPKASKPEATAEA